MRQIRRLISKSINIEWKSQQNTRIYMRGKERTWVMNWFISWETKVSKQTQSNHVHITKHNESIMYSNQIKSINQSIIKSHMLGPHQSPIYFAWINITNFIILILWKIHSYLLKRELNLRIWILEIKFERN